MITATQKKRLDSKTVLEFKAELHRIGGQEPYFSLTGEERVHGRIESCGCMHDEILKHWPQLAPIEALHLSTQDGIPMYAVANGWYWAGGNKEWCKGGQGDPPRADYLAHHLRISQTEAERIIQCIALGEMDKPEFARLVEAQKPRWKAEALAGIALINQMAERGQE